MLLVSDLACTELGSHHSIPTSKKLNKMKNQQLFLAPQEKWGHRANPCPPDGKDCIYRESQPIRAETSVGTSAEVRKPECSWQIAGGPLWASLRDKNSRGTQSSGSPQHFCEFYFLKLYQVHTVNTAQKYSHAPSRGMGKETILKYARAFVLSKIWPREKLFNQSLTC